MSAVNPLLFKCIALTLFSVLAIPVSGQEPVRHELIRGDLPPGVAADYSLMSNRALRHHVQPVQVIVPQSATVEVAHGDGFAGRTQESMSVGLLVGPVYRFKVSNLPIDGHQQDSLYPSVELINRLYPPAGLANEFPIQVVLTTQDLKLALEGQMVTRVIYLENPRGPLPNKHVKGLQPSFDIGGGEDPLRVAEDLGRPMAIVRLGSRTPMPGDLADHFHFGAPNPTILPLPSRFLSARKQRQPVSSNDLALAPAPVVASDTPHPMVSGSNAPGEPVVTASRVQPAGYTTDNGGRRMTVTPQTGVAPISQSHGTNR